jgi:hypothetical protein
MDSNLIVGVLALIFLVAFFAANLKAAQELKILGAGPAKVLAPQRWLWRLTGNEERFLLVVFLVEIGLLVLGGVISVKPGDPITSSYWGALYFGILAAASIFDILRKRK